MLPSSQQIIGRLHLLYITPQLPQSPLGALLGAMDCWRGFAVVPRGHLALRVLPRHCSLYALCRWNLKTKVREVSQLPLHIAWRFKLYKKWRWKIIPMKTYSTYFTSYVILSWFVRLRKLVFVVLDFVNFFHGPYPKSFGFRLIKNVYWIVFRNQSSRVARRTLKLSR